MNSVVQQLIHVLQGWDAVIRGICLVGCLGILIGLFYVGGEPVAVGLFKPPMDKVVHFLTFGLITLLLWIAMLRGRPWLLVLIVACIGAADEIHQMFLPGRSAGLDDFAFDFAGACVMTLLLSRIHRAAT